MMLGGWLRLFLRLLGLLSMLKHLGHVHGCIVVRADLFELEVLKVNFVHADVPN